MHIIASFLIFLLCIPAMVASIPVVSILLLTSWDGRSTIFGNAKWGRGNTHPSPDNRTIGYWQEWKWLVWQNPVNNLMAITLAISGKTYVVSGDEGIGDKLKPGFYAIRMGWAWEYYWIKPYKILGKRRCIRVRLGWKIYGTSRGDLCPYVWAINPFKEYSGV